MYIDATEAIRRANVIIDEREKLVRLAKQVRSTAMRLERQFAELLDVEEGIRMFCEEGGCMNTLSYSERCSDTKCEDHRPF